MAGAVHSGNLSPVLLLLGWRLEAWSDRRWQAVFAVDSVGSLTWVELTIGQFQMPTPVMILTLAIVTVLSVQGFGFLLSGEVRMYLEMTSANPDPEGHQFDRRAERQTWRRARGRSASAGFGDGVSSLLRAPRTEAVLSGSAPRIVSTAKALRSHGRLFPQAQDRLRVW